MVAYKIQHMRYFDAKAQRILSFSHKKHYFRAVRICLFSIILSLLWSAGITNSAAQGYDIYTSYGIDDGLPQSSIWSVVQDKNGFIWAGTSDGLCRFDGYTFTVYKNNPADPNSIVEGLYYKSYIDSTGTMWVVSQKGISRYNDDKGNFTTVFIYDNKYPAELYTNILGEDVDYVWAIVAGYGFLKINKHDHKKAPILEAGNKKYLEQMPNFTSGQNGIVNNNKIWMCAGSGNNISCYIYDIKKKQLFKPAIPNVTCIINFNDSEVIAAKTYGLIVLNKNNFTYKTLDFADKVKEIRSKDMLLSGADLLLATQYGLVTVDTRSWQIVKAVHSFTQGKKQSYANVQCLYKDRSGNIWIGINGDGLKKLTAPWNKFRLYSSYNDSSNLVKGIYVNGKYLYAAYFGNGVDIFDRKSGFIKNLTFSAQYSLLRHVHAISTADSNTLLLNTGDSNIIYSYDMRSNNASLNSLLPVIKKALPDHKNSLNYIPFIYRSGNDIYTGIKDYLISLDVSSAKNIKVNEVYFLPGDRLSCAFKDSKGTIWAGCINGIAYLDGNKPIKIALPETVQVKSINEDTKGNIWAATIDGIYVIDSNKKVLQHYTENNGLSNRFIYGILRDDDGNMWFSHNKGLSVFKAATHTFRHYTKEDGLQSNEFNTGAYFKADDGTLFFGGVNGTNAFDPREISDNPNKPNVKITDIEVFDKKLKSDIAYWNVKNITLPYTQNSLSFEFTALEFTSPTQNRYAYMMENVDNDWINSGDKRFARYPGLPPGQYTFKVKACNNDGIWQEIPTTISITIVPPFWQRLWFRILIAVLLIGCITGIILWFQKQAYKRKMRAIELQQKIQMERERISRDLHDNVGTQLSLISNNVEWIQHPLKPMTDEEKADKLNFVNQTARDIIATLRETIWALSKEQISLEEFSDKLKAFVQKQLTIYPQIGLNFGEQITGAIILGPSEALNLFRICQEAIANALKYSGATHINIDIKSGTAKYTVSITDDGKGFDINSVDPSIQNGLENMKYRADDINGTLTISTAPGKGTTVAITKNRANAV